MTEVVLGYGFFLFLKIPIGGFERIGVGRVGVVNRGEKRVFYQLI